MSATKRLGCLNCRYFKYDTEDKLYICKKEREIDPDVFDRMWINEEDWSRDDEPVCSEYRECGGNEDDEICNDLY